MPSDAYVQNWQKANEWLHKNAPKHVLDCLHEAFDAMKATIDRLQAGPDELEKAMTLVETMKSAATQHD